MLKTDGGTTSTPMLLVVAALSLFAVRCFLVSQEVSHPPKPQYQVAWNDVPLTAKNPEQKPILYMFTSSAIAPCQQLEKDTFTNRAVVELVEKNFIPVRVEDLGMTKKSNSNTVDELETKYMVREFPTLVVALPSGRSVDDDSALVRIRPVKDFLSNAMREAPYSQALENLEEGEYDKAADSLAKYLGQPNIVKISPMFSPYWAMVDRYVCLRFLHRDQEATAVLDEAEKKLNHLIYPYQIIAYFRGDIDFEELKEASRLGLHGSMEARAYAGLQEYFEGHDKQAREYLQYAVDQKNMGNRIPVKFALHALTLMDEQAQGKKAEKAK